MDEPLPLFIPACLSAAVVRLLVKSGIEAASKYKSHYNIKTVGPSEMQQQLVLARFKLGQISTLDQTAFAAEIALAQAEVISLEEKLGASADLEGCSVDQAPGVDTGLLSKLTQILSRHQKAMAREAEEHQLLVTSLEAQVAELQLQSRPLSVCISCRLQPTRSSWSACSPRWRQSQLLPRRAR